MKTERYKGLLLCKHHSEEKAENISGYFEMVRRCSLGGKICFQPDKCVKYE